MTIVSWLMATILPLKCAGEISAIYIGDSMEAMPTPIPAQNLDAIKISLVGEKAIAKDERAKITAAINNPGLRPYLSATIPATTQPAIAPNARLPVAKPSQYSFSSNCFCRKGNAPAITAKSNPNKYLLPWRQWQSKDQEIRV